MLEIGLISSINLYPEYNVPRNFNDKINSVGVDLFQVKYNRNKGTLR